MAADTPARTVGVMQRTWLPTALTCPACGHGWHPTGTCPDYIAAGGVATACACRSTERSGTLRRAEPRACCNTTVADHHRNDCHQVTARVPR